MKAVIPTLITDARLISSTVPEPDATAEGDGPGAVVWASGTTYAAGAIVVRAETHRRYRSVDNGNIGNVPENTLAATPPKWVDLGNTNRWRMLRANGSMPTSAPSPLIVEIEPSRRVQTLAIPNVQADSVLIEQIDTTTDEVIFTYEQELLSYDPINWYEYFYGEFDAVGSVLVNGLLPNSTTMIRVTLTRATGNVQSGPIVVGNEVELGSMEQGAKVGAIDFSQVDRDAFGNALLVPRRVVPETSQRLLVPAGATDRILRALQEMRATVVLWSGIDEPGHPYFQSLFVLGLVRRWDFSHDEYNYTYLTLDIEGF